MAQFNVGDKILRLPRYMDGRFRYRAHPKKVVAVLLDKGLYLLLNPNDTATEVSVLDGTQRVSRYYYSIAYIDRNYRLATPDEVITYFENY